MWRKPSIKSRSNANRCPKNVSDLCPQLVLTHDMFLCFMSPSPLYHSYSFPSLLPELFCFVDHPCPSNFLFSKTCSFCILSPEHHQFLFLCVCLQWPKWIKCRPFKLKVCVGVWVCPVVFMHMRAGLCLRVFTPTLSPAHCLYTQESGEAG